MPFPSINEMHVFDDNTGEAMTKMSSNSGCFYFVVVFCLNDGYAISVSVDGERATISNVQSS